jgi:hypothetical protein
MDWTETEAGVWKSGDFEIRHIWFSVRETWDLYRGGKPIGGYDTLEKAKEAATRPVTP